MSETPSTPSYDGRNPDGTFSRGNRAGRGSSVGRKAAKFRTALFASVKAADFREIAQRLLQEAKSGESWAIKLVLEYLVGPPVPADVLERLENLEAAAEGRQPSWHQSKSEWKR